MRVTPPWFLCLALLVVGMLAPVLPACGEESAQDECFTNILGLANRNPKVRISAANALGELRDSRAVEPLMGLATDRDAGVRASVIAALSNLADQRADAVMMRAIDDPDPLVRSWGIYYLPYLDSPRMPEILAKAIRDSNSDVRQEALSILCREKDAASLTLVAGEIAHPDAKRRLQALKAAHFTNMVSHPGLMRAICAAATDRDAAVRKEAGELFIRSLDAMIPLADVPWPETMVRMLATGAEAVVDSDYLPVLLPATQRQMIGRLTALMQDKDGKVRLATVRVLVRYAGTEAVPSLLNALRDPQASVRITAARGLGATKDARALEPLQTLFSDPDPTVRAVAAEALGALGDRNAVKPLVERLTDQALPVRIAAGKALTLLGDTRGGDALVALMHDTKGEFRADIICTLGEQGDARVLPQLYDLGQDNKYFYRVFEALKQYHDQQAKDVIEYVLVKFQDDKRNDVSLQTYIMNYVGDSTDSCFLRPLLQMAGQCDMPRHQQLVMAKLRPYAQASLNPLFDALRDANPDIRVGAITVLIRYGDARVPSHLDALRNDASPLVRLAVAEGLAAFGDPRANALLTALLTDTTLEVREKALDTLIKLDDPAMLDSLVRMLNDNNSSVRMEAARCLSNNIYPPAFAALATRMEKETDRDVQMTLSITLLRYVAPENADTVWQLLPHIETSCRNSVLNKLVKVKHPGALQWAKDQLTSTCVADRYQGVSLLGQCDEPWVMPLLLAARKDSNREIQHAAAIYLACKGDSRAVDAAFLASPYTQYSDEYSTYGLDQLTEKDATLVEAMANAAQSPRPLVRYGAAYLLSYLDDPRAVAPIIACLHDDNLDIRNCAVEGLATQRTTESVAACLALLDDPRGYIRAKAANALGEIGDRQAIAPLRQTLTTDPNQYTRDCAAMALFKLGELDMRERILSRIDQGYQLVEAAPLLAKMGDTRAIQPLIDQIKWESFTDIRQDAAKTLHAITGQDFGINPIRWQAWWNKERLSGK